MIVDYARRAVADLNDISDYYSTNAAPRVAERFEVRFRAVVERVARHPQSARPAAGRPGVRVVPLVSFPYKVFYRIVAPDRIRILHIRHEARAPWE